jgi:UPF0716 protein FxsA
MGACTKYSKVVARLARATREGRVPLLILALVPLLDVIALVAMGDGFGLWPTLGYVVGAVVCGAIAMMLGGAGTLAVLRAELAGGRGDMGRVIAAVARGAAGVLAGLLLLFPGPISDLFALVLLAVALVFGLRAPRPPVFPAADGKVVDVAYEVVPPAEPGRGWGRS